MLGIFAVPLFRFETRRNRRLHKNFGFQLTISELNNVGIPAPSFRDLSLLLRRDKLWGVRLKFMYGSLAPPEFHCSRHISTPGFTLEHGLKNFRSSPVWSLTNTSMAHNSPPLTMPWNELLLKFILTCWKLTGKDMRCETKQMGILKLVAKFDINSGYFWQLHGHSYQDLWRNLDFFHCICARIFFLHLWHH